MDFEMQVIYCPICGKEHECEFHDEYVYTTLHDVPIRYQKQFYRCPIAFKMNDEESDWMTGAQCDQNLKNARQAYQNKIESRE